MFGAQSFWYSDWCDFATMSWQLQDGLTGSAWGDWANYTASPLRAFENELGVQAPVGFWDPAGFTADGSVENFKRRRQTECLRISLLERQLQQETLDPRLMVRHAQRTHGRAPHVRRLLPTCHIGFLNTCSLRCTYEILADGTLHSEGEEQFESLKLHMCNHKLYALALSEIRWTGSGSVDVGGGYSFIFAGSPGDGAHGGVGFLLSPGATQAWKRAGGSAKAAASGRVLRISLACAEGKWHLVSTYGPTMQSADDEKIVFWQDLQSDMNLPAREPLFVVGDLNCLIDLALTNCCNRRFVTDVRSLPVDVQSDHLLMILKLRASPQAERSQSPLFAARPNDAVVSKRPPRLCVAALKSAATVTAFSDNVFSRVLQNGTGWILRFCPSISERRAKRSLVWFGARGLTGGRDMRS
eukprot:s94_g25.t1